MSAICFDHVSKQFTLHHERSRSFQELFLNVVRLKRPSLKEKYWALRDVSFKIAPGEMVGIVGDNGAGKSTMLKLMSHIIEPTSGTISIHGRVSALLELGAGFHPDLTGRENIYLNGSILGFGRDKMRRIFADILEFSEMERFIDVPVKHYSSGMYMRLGFSIAIHVRPDILLVDEILAVGDQAFQLRCLDRINEMKRRGITIVLVTHNLDTVRELCNRAIWLDDGSIQAEGKADYVLEQYMGQVRAEDREALRQAEAEAEEDISWRWGSREVEIVRVQLLDAQGQERRSYQTGEPFIVRMHFNAHQRIEKPQFGLALYHASGFHINGPNTVFSGLDIEAIEGRGYVDYTIDSLPLLEGTYLVSVAAYDYEGHHAYDHHHQAYTFRVRPNAAIREEFGSFLIPSGWRLGTGNGPESQRAGATSSGVTAQAHAMPGGLSPDSESDEP
jgi:ABC-type polysaccharide/polyol phosphate transport system ATPase subunit